MKTYWVSDATFVHVLPNGKVYINEALWPHMSWHTLIPFLRKYLGVTYIDGLIISHYHFNGHHGGAAALIKGMKGKIGAIYASGVYSTGDQYSQDLVWQDAMLDEINKYNIPYHYVKHGDQIREGEVMIDFWGPLPQHAPPNRTETDRPNDESMVLSRFSYGDYSFLFTGDIPLNPMKEVLEEIENPKTTLLHITHHGDGNWIDQEILDTIDPELALVEKDRNNIFNVLGDIPYYYFEEGGRNRVEITGKRDGTFTLNENVPEKIIFSRGG